MPGQPLPTSMPPSPPFNPPSLGVPVHICEFRVTAWHMPADKGRPEPASERRCSSNTEEGEEHRWQLSSPDRLLGSLLLGRPLAKYLRRPQFTLRLRLAIHSPFLQGPATAQPWTGIKGPLPQGLWLRPRRGAAAYRFFLFSFLRMSALLWPAHRLFLSSTNCPVPLISSGNSFEPPATALV